MTYDATDSYFLSALRMGRGQEPLEPDQTRHLVRGSTATVVSDSDDLEIYDEDHSEHEDRFIGIGPIARGIIMVVFTERDEDVVRIISARPATKREQQMFHRYSRGST